MLLTGTQLAKAMQVDRRTVTNWLNESPPCPSQGSGRARRIPMGLFAAWWAARVVAEHRKVWERERPLGDEVQRARERRMVIETRLVEIELEQLEGSVIALDVHEKRVGALCELLAARVKGLGKYIGDVQMAHTDIDAATVLERMSDELLRSLVETADEISDDGEQSSEGEEAA